MNLKAYAATAIQTNVEAGAAPFESADRTRAAVWLANVGVGGSGGGGTDETAVSLADPAGWSPTMKLPSVAQGSVARPSRGSRRSIASGCGRRRLEGITTVS